MSGKSLASTAEATKVPLDVIKGASNGDVANAVLDRVNTLVDTIMKASGGGGDEDEETEEDTEKADKRKRYMAKLKKAGMESDAIETAMKAFDGMDDEEDDEDAKAKGKKKKAKKSIDDDEPTSKAVTMTPDELHEATMDSIAKAKVFTPSRVAKIRTVTEELQKLLIDVIGVGDSPKSTVPAVQQHGNSSGVRSMTSPSKMPVMKSADGDDDEDETMKALRAVVSKLDKLVSGAEVKKSKGGDESASDTLEGKLATILKRLDAIEGARPAPKSEGEGESDGTKVQKSFWGGVL